MTTTPAHPLLGHEVGGHRLARVRTAGSGFTDFDAVRSRDPSPSAGVIASRATSERHGGPRVGATNAWVRVWHADAASGEDARRWQRVLGRGHRRRATVMSAADRVGATGMPAAELRRRETAVLTCGRVPSPVLPRATAFCVLPDPSCDESGRDAHAAILPEVAHSLVDLVRADGGVCAGHAAAFATTLVHFVADVLEAGLTLRPLEPADIGVRPDGMPILTSLSAVTVTTAGPSAPDAGPVPDRAPGHPLNALTAVVRALSAGVERHAVSARSERSAQRVGSPRRSLSEEWERWGSTLVVEAARPALTVIESRLLAFAESEG